MLEPSPNKVLEKAIYFGSKNNLHNSCSYANYKYYKQPKKGGELALLDIYGFTHLYLKTYFIGSVFKNI